MMVRQRWMQRRGQSIVEYLLVASAVIAAFVVVGQLFGNTATGPIRNIYNDSGVAVTNAGTTLGNLGP